MCLDVDAVDRGEVADGALANLGEELDLYFDGDDFPDAFELPIITTALIPA